MTTIAALYVPGLGAVIGSDRQYTTGNRKRFAEPKWVLANGWAIGVSGEGRALGLLQQHWHEMTEDKKVSPFDLTNALVAMLSEYNMKPTLEEGSCAPLFENTFLMAHKTGAWHIDFALNLTSIKAGELDAAGSGQQFAIGAGYATRHMTDHVLRLKQAIEIACFFDIGSGGKIWTHVLPRNENVIPFPASVKAAS